MTIARTFSHALDKAGCIESATDDHPLARRNMLIGLWAGRQLGLDGAALESYVKSAVQADLTEPGDDDLIRKLLTDRVASGVPADEAEIRVRLQDFHRVAWQQHGVTD